jgi:hypothetical protein
MVETANRPSKDSKLPRDLNLATHTLPEFKVLVISVPR